MVCTQLQQSSITWGKFGEEEGQGRAFPPPSFPFAACPAGGGRAVPPSQVSEAQYLLDALNFEQSGCRAWFGSATAQMSFSGDNLHQGTRVPLPVSPAPYEAVGTP